MYLTDFIRINVSDTEDFSIPWFRGHQVRWLNIYRIISFYIIIVSFHRFYITQDFRQYGTKDFIFIFK